MAIGWLKIWRDLRCYPQQTGYLLLAVASSVFVVTTLLTTHSLLAKSLNHTLSARPQPDALYAASGVGKALLAQMQTLPGVAHVGAGRIESFRMRYGDELWHELRLQASSDLTPTQGLHLVSGTWPTSAPVTVALERSSQAVTAARPGATLRLYRDDRGEIPVTVTGLVDDPAATPSRFLSNLLRGFATVEGLSALTGEQGYDWVYVFLSPDLTPTTQKQTLAAVEGLLTADGYAIHPRQPDGPNQTLFRFIEAALLLLSVFALLSILLSGAWVSHVMTGILLREQTVIGVLKTLGFQRWQIAALYLGQALLLGAVAALAGSLLGSGAGLLAANATASGLLDKSLTHTVPPLSGVGVGLAVGLGAALLGAWQPVWHNTSISIQTVLATTPKTMTRWPPHWLASHLSPDWLYVGRNLLRHQGRLAFTTATLLLAGVIFVTTVTLSTSIARTLTTLMAYWQADVRIETALPVGTYVVRNEVLALPGAASIEARLVEENVRLRPDGSQSPRPFNLVGLPPTSPFLQPTLLAGRWLRDDDLAAVVVDSELLRMEPDLHVGAPLVIPVQGTPVTWQIVGVATGQLLGYSLTNSAAAYVSYRYLSELSQRSGLANFYLVGTQTQEPTAQKALALHIEESLHRYRFSQTVLEPAFVRAATARQIFGLVTTLALAMSLLFALLGGLSLANLMGLALWERQREIGILRAVGSDSRSLTRLLTGEALVIALSSGAAALLAAWPASWLLCGQVGGVLINTPLTYQYAADGAVGWLLLSGFLAWASTQKSIRTLTRGPVRTLLR